MWEIESTTNLDPLVEVSLKIAQYLGRNPGFHTLAEIHTGVNEGRHGVSREQLRQLLNQLIRSGFVEVQTRTGNRGQYRTFKLKD